MQIYHLAALLSATAEKDPAVCLELNMDGLLNVLERWPCSTRCRRCTGPAPSPCSAPTRPASTRPRLTIMNPNTVYGISKLAGEQWCEWYHRHHGLDVRSLRYPGLIGYKSLPGGGTTDYAVDIYHKQAVASADFECFLRPDTLPAHDVHARRAQGHPGPDARPGRKHPGAHQLQPGRHELLARRNRGQHPAGNPGFSRFPTPPTAARPSPTRGPPASTTRPLVGTGAGSRNTI
ncbi:MAG: NAD-dependent epimerase/dehydratase family protein [Hymenobacter sp.]